MYGHYGRVSVLEDSQYDVSLCGGLWKAATEREIERERSTLRETKNVKRREREREGRKQGT